jgi:hypothetical protein
MWPWIARREIHRGIRGGDGTYVVNGIGQPQATTLLPNG